MRSLEQMREKPTVAAAMNGKKTFDAPTKHDKSTLAFGALVLFSFLYFARPEDMIPGADAIPVGKISGGIALVGLIAGLFTRRVKAKFPVELKLMLVLFAHLCVTIVFSVWRGGSFQIVTQQFSKGVIVALLIAFVIERVDQLRKLLLVQAGSIAVMTVLSIIIHPGGSARLSGISNGILGNPNDLAINIAINWPLALAFVLASRGMFKKALWLIGLLGLFYGVVGTYSRSGSIAMIICFAICIWEFAIRGKRFLLLAGAGFLALVVVVVMVATPHYMTRMESLMEGNIEGSGDHGSLEARQQLLTDSIELTKKHPLFGVGPGNFPVVTESWHVTHNTYTELSCETGLPGLIIYLLILVFAFRNLARVRKTPGYQANEEIRLYTSALWAGLAAYLVGAAFSSTEYNLFPYFMVAYTSAIYRISSEYVPEETAPAKKESHGGNWRKRIYTTERKPEFAGTR
jgi:O-antigen ligase